VEIYVPSVSQQAEWDKWFMKSKGASRGRDVIVPEVSRTFHDGGGGAHVSGYAQVTFYERGLVCTDRWARVRNLPRWADPKNANVVSLLSFA